LKLDGSQSFTSFFILCSEKRAPRTPKGIKKKIKHRIGKPRRAKKLVLMAKGRRTFRRGETSLSAAAE
jgi:hypothetical protein